MNVCIGLALLYIPGMLWLTILYGSYPVDIKEVLREKCREILGPEAPDPDEWFNKLNQCVEKTFSDNSDQDLNWTTYCSKLPALKNCVKYTSSLSRPCLTLEEQETVDVINNVTSSFLEFTCHDEVLSSYAINEQQIISKDDLSNCLNQSMSSYDPDTSSVGNAVDSLKEKSLKPLVVDIQSCINMKRFQNCTVKVIEKSKNQTVAHAVELMFNSMIKVTPCEKLLKAQASLPTEILSSTVTLERISSPEEQLRMFVRKRCEKNVNSTVSDSAVEALRLFSNCFAMLVNTTQIEAEVIRAAVVNRKLDTVFHKYCLKRPILTECIKYATDAIEPCLVSDERETYNLIQNMTSSWLGNVCHHYGDPVEACNDLAH